MNLHIPPTPENQAALDAALGGEPVNLCLPCDLSLEGARGSGAVAFTPTRVAVVNEGQLQALYRLNEFAEFTGRAMIGNGILEGTRQDGTPVLLARFSMYQVPRYMQAARMVTRALQDLPPPPDSRLEDRVCAKCGRALPRGSRICPHCMDKGKTIKRMLSIARPFWPMLAAAVLMMFVVGGLELLSPVVWKYLVDDFLKIEDVSLLPGNAAWIIFALCSLTFLISAAATGLNVIRGRTMVRLAAKLSGKLRNMVYGKLQAMSLSYMNARRTGDMMNRITEDTDRIKGFVEHQAPMAVNTLVRLVALLTILFVFNWRFALIVIIPMPIAMQVSRSFRRRVWRMYHMQWRLADRANSLLQDILTGIRVVKSYGKEQVEVDRYAKASRAMANRIRDNEKKFNTVFPLTGFIMEIGSFLMFYYAGYLVLGQHMSVGQMVQYSAYTGMLYGPVRYIIMLPRWWAQTMTSAERVFEILDEEPEIANVSHPHSGGLQGDVVFDRVTFGYQAYEPVLHDINLRVQPGEIIGLVGASGSGKSTLTNLVLRLYDVQEGTLSVGGVDIRDYDLDDVRRRVGVVLQENFLFTGTIYENLRYAKPTATPEEVIRAAKVANAHDFIMKFPDAYNTYVGENGQNLSGGERQRIAIARAILHNPSILILDEATASLDTETEKAIQEALQKLMQGRTVFAIAHRLSTLKNANRLVVLDKGRIAEVGTHNELLLKQGIYFNLVMMQRQLGKMKA